MGNPKIGIAVIGIGGNMGSHKAVILRQIDKVNLVGVEKDKKNRKLMERKLNVPVYEDAAEIWRRKDIVGVTIDTPNYTHASLTIQALREGKAVLCEKPMATNMTDCKAMVKAAKTTGGFLQFGFELRYSKLYARMKEIVDSGEIGKVVNVSCVYTPGAGVDGRKWKSDLKSSGGIFCEKLCHYIDFGRWITGSDIDEIICLAGNNVIPYYKIIDNCHTGYRLKNGAVGNLSFNLTKAAEPMVFNTNACIEAGHQLDHWILGSKGSIFCNLWEKWIKVVRHYKEKKFRPRLDRKENYSNTDDEIFCHNVTDEVKDFVNRIAKGKEPFIPPEDSLKTMIACFAAEESAKDRKVVKCRYSRK